mgnify:CR=1 FL=1
MSGRATRTRMGIATTSSWTQWFGPFKLREYLDRHGGVPDSELPPESPACYCVSVHGWSGEPNRTAEILVIGKAYAIKSGGVRSRVASLLPCLFGFHGPTKTSAGFHRPGIRTNVEFIRAAMQNPMDLYIAWLSMPGASEQQVLAREAELTKQLQPRYNKPRKN